MTISDLLGAVDPAKFDPAARISASESVIDSIRTGMTPLTRFRRRYTSGRGVNANTV